MYEKRKGLIIVLIKGRPSQLNGTLMKIIKLYSVTQFNKDELISTEHDCYTLPTLNLYVIHNTLNIPVLTLENMVVRIMNKLLYT